MALVSNDPIPDTRTPGYGRFARAGKPAYRRAVITPFGDATGALAWLNDGAVIGTPAYIATHPYQTNTWIFRYISFYSIESPSDWRLSVFWVLSNPITNTMDITAAVADRRTTPNKVGTWLDPYQLKDTIPAEPYTLIIESWGLDPPELPIASIRIEPIPFWDTITRRFPHARFPTS